jgi:hypothetical protein
VHGARLKRARQPGSDGSKRLRWAHQAPRRFREGCNAHPFRCRPCSALAATVGTSGRAFSRAGLAAQDCAPGAPVRRAPRAPRFEEHCEVLFRDFESCIRKVKSHLSHVPITRPHLQADRFKVVWPRSRSSHKSYVESPSGTTDLSFARRIVRPGLTRDGRDRKS